MNNLIRIENGKPMANSREVAEHFGKNHKHVLEAIENLIEGVAEKSADLFSKSQYQHPQNKQWYPEYLMTRDGFSLLVMGFTGKSALEWKLKYIDAFNKMEEQIKGSVIPSTKSKPLSSVNHAAQIMAKAYDSAGIDPNYKVLALTNLYQNEGLAFPSPPLTAEKTYDATEIANCLGVLSQSEKPHSQLIGAIIRTLNICDGLVIHAPYDRNGHAADYDRYKEPVVDMVREWLSEKYCPDIVRVCGKNYKVKYKKGSLIAS